MDGKIFCRPGLINRNYSKACRVTEETPWELLRCLLLRNIWCQRCGTVMRNETFHLGTAMHQAWRTVIQIGVASWRKIWKHTETAPHQTEVFTTTWTASQAFCSMNDKLVWHFILPNEFLPQDLARRPATVINLDSQGGRRRGDRHYPHRDLADIWQYSCFRRPDNGKGHTPPKGRDQSCLTKS